MITTIKTHLQENRPSLLLKNIEDVSDDIEMYKFEMSILKKDGHQVDFGNVKLYGEDLGFMKYLQDSDKAYNEFIRFFLTHTVFYEMVDAKDNDNLTEWSLWRNRFIVLASIFQEHNNDTFDDMFKLSEESTTFNWDNTENNTTPSKEESEVKSYTINTLKTIAKEYIEETNNQGIVADVMNNIETDPLNECDFQDEFEREMEKAVAGFIDDFVNYIHESTNDNNEVNDCPWSILETHLMSLPLDEEAREELDSQFGYLRQRCFELESELD